MSVPRRIKSPSAISPSRAPRSRTSGCASFSAMCGSYPSVPGENRLRNGMKAKRLKMPSVVSERRGTEFMENTIEALGLNS